MQFCKECLLPFFVLALLLTMACAQEPPASRQDVLVSVTDSLIVPWFETVASEMRQLRDGLHSLFANPNSDTLGAVRTARREARGPVDAVTGDVVRPGDGATIAHGGGLVAR